MKFVVMAVAASLVASTGMAHAGCDFFEHNDHKGAKLALKDGECAYFVQNQSAGCGNLPAKFVDGWDKRISSIVLNHNSQAVVMTNGDGTGPGGLYKDFRGVKSMAEFNDQASLVICRQ